MCSGLGVKPPNGSNVPNTGCPVQPAHERADQPALRRPLNTHFVEVSRGLRQCYLNISVAKGAGHSCLGLGTGQRSLRVPRGSAPDAY